MRRLVLGTALLVGAVSLSGCYYDPGYSYVRGNGYVGDAYYGSGSTVVYDNGYYAPGYYGGYGCCYSPGVVVGGVWYRDRYRYHDGWYGRPGGWRGPGGRGDWHGPPPRYGAGPWRGGNGGGPRGEGRPPYRGGVGPGPRGTRPVPPDRQ